MKLYFYLFLTIFGVMCQLMIYNPVKAKTSQTTQTSRSPDPEPVPGPPPVYDPEPIVGNDGDSDIRLPEALRQRYPRRPTGGLYVPVTLESIQRRSNGDTKLNFSIEKRYCRSVVNLSQEQRSDDPSPVNTPTSENHPSCISRYSYIDDDGIASLVTVQYILKHKYQGRRLSETVPSEEKLTLDFIKENLERARKHYDDLVYEYRDNSDLSRFYENKREHVSDALKSFSRQPIRFRQLHDLGNFLEDVTPEHEYQVKDENDRLINNLPIGGGRLIGVGAGGTGLEIAMHHSSSNGLGLLQPDPRDPTILKRTTQVKGNDLNQLIQQSRPIPARPFPQNFEGQR